MSDLRKATLALLQSMIEDESGHPSEAVCVAWAKAFEAAAKKPPEPEQVVRWVNLYRRADGSLSFGGCMPIDCAQQFREIAADSSGPAIARARVEWVEGQFDDENTPDPYTKGWNEALARAVDEMDEIDLYERDRISAKQAIRSLKRSTP